MVLRTANLRIVMLTLILGVLALGVVSTQAQTPTLTYVGQSVTCSSIEVTYNVTGAGDPPGGVLVEAVVAGSPLANDDGPGSNGDHTVELNFTPQSPGTLVRGRVSNGISTVQGTNEPCEGGGGSEGGGGGGDDDEPDQPPPWGGYSDGRLNPDPAEYYSIWCSDDLIHVYRAVPETDLLKQIPLVDVIALDVGGETALGDFMTLVRNTEDTITIYGSNGNLAPEAGSKAFSLSECIARNGGVPEQPPPQSPPQSPPDSDDTEPTGPSPEEEADARLEFCFASYDFLEDLWLLAGCLNDVLTDHLEGLSGAEIVALVIMTFCLNIIVGNGILPIGIVILLGMHRRWLRRWKPPAQ